MDVAFVLINAEIGKEEKVLEDLKIFSEVKASYGVYGVYDIIARIETEDVKEVVNRIRLIEGVHSTLTMITV
jgi:DNA-binding Lrp family transcriptional regulator